MRLCETQKVYGIVLISACWTDLGMKSETISGYYSREWEWKKIRENCNFVIQFHSKDDPFIPLSEALHVKENLEKWGNVEYHQYDDKGHFMTPTSPTIFSIIKEKLSNIK